MKKQWERSHKGAIGLGIVCWLTYFSIYLGRLNFSASMSEMIQAGVWGKAELGSVAAAFYLAYGLGQLPSGILGDRLPAKRLVALGLAGTAAVNGIFPFIGTAMGMQAAWFLNGLMQAMIWPPMARLITDRIHGKQAVTIMLLMSFTSPAGMLCAYFVSAVMMKIGNWKYCFWSAGVWLAVIAAFWFVSVSRLETLCKGGDESRTEEKEEKRRVMGRNVGISFAASGFLWMLAATFIHGVLKDGLTTWIPTYLAEKFSITPSFSVLLTMVLPVINLSGVYIAGISNKSIFKNEAASAAMAFSLSFLGISFMIWGGDSLYGTVGLFAVVTSMMTAVNTLFISLLPMHFQKEGKVATVSGVLNAVTYVGSAAASAVFGYAAETAGWTGTQMMWCFCAAAGLICSLAAIKRWSRRRKDIYQNEGGIQE